MNRPKGLGVAVFRNDAGGMFALLARCPLHNSTIGLCDGQASAPDAGCTPKFAVKVEDGAVYLDARELATVATDLTRPIAGPARRGLPA